MQAYQIETILQEDGTLTLKDLPFRAGERIEVIVLGKPRPVGEPPYPLRGTPYRYDEPTEPVAEKDWEATQ